MQTKPISNEPAFCSDNAYLNLQDFELVGPKNSKDYHDRYVPEMAYKYPVLKDAYGLLYECWKHYHPEEKK